MSQLGELGELNRPPACAKYGRQCQLAALFGAQQERQKYTAIWWLLKTSYSGKLGNELIYEKYKCPTYDLPHPGNMGSSYWKGLQIWHLPLHDATEAKDD